MQASLSRYKTRMKIYWGQTMTPLILCNTRLSSLSASPCRNKYMLILPFKSCSMCSPLPWIRALRFITGWGQGMTWPRQGEKSKHLYLNFPPWVSARRWGPCIRQMWGTWGKRTSRLNPHASSGSSLWLSLATCPYPGTVTWKWTLSCKLVRPRAALVFSLSPAVPGFYVVRMRPGSPWGFIRWDSGGS